jgi:hypothetical protein
MGLGVANGACIIGVCIASVFYGVGIFLAIMTGFQWKEMIDAENAVYEEKTCIVLGTSTDSWDVCSSSDDGTAHRRTHCSMVYLPQVKVMVQGDPRGPNKPLIAHKYRRAYSSTSSTEYEPSHQAYIAGFADDTKVPCWQKVGDPEVVKLAAEKNHSGGYFPAIFLTFFSLFWNGFLCIPLCLLMQEKFRGGTLVDEDEESNKSDEHE